MLIFEVKRHPKNRDLYFWDARENGLIVAASHDLFQTSKAANLALSNFIYLIQHRQMKRSEEKSP